MNAQRHESEDSGAAELDWICRSVLRANFPLFRQAEISGSFYPYIGLTHTIRRQGLHWKLRISDHCSSAPRRVLESIVFILGCKIVRRRPPVDVAAIYDGFRARAEVKAAVHARRLSQGRKIIRSAPGRHQSLSEIYDEINSRYFSNQVDVRQIGWGPRRSWGRLGHYDPVHNTITISPVLDAKQVPREIVAYIVYHEMLHAFFCDDSPRKPRRHHSPEYRRIERAYPGYSAAKQFLAEFCRHRGAPD